MPHNQYIDFTVGQCSLKVASKFLKKMPKGINRLLGEYSHNLATLGLRMIFC
jgi:hypothetical protein